MAEKLKFRSYLRILVPIERHVSGIARRSARRNTDVMLILLGYFSGDISGVLAA